MIAFYEYGRFIIIVNNSILKNFLPKPCYIFWIYVLRPAPGYIGCPFQTPIYNILALCS